MEWITGNPEIFIIGVISLLLCAVIWRLYESKSLGKSQNSHDLPVDSKSENSLEAVSGTEDLTTERDGKVVLEPAKSTEIEKRQSQGTQNSIDYAPTVQDSDEDKAALEIETESGAAASSINDQQPNFFVAALKKSRDAFMGGLSSLWSGEPLDEEALEELEDTLIGADVGAQVAMEIIEALKEQAEAGADGSALKAHLRTLLLDRIGEPSPIVSVSEGPLVILVVGVNGSGKTTTIGKLAHRYIQSGKKVLVAAGDTFRAGAIEQLKVWADRSGAEFVSSQPKADPASVIYSALEAALAREVDVVICDTAGRLQAQSSLMDELKKVARVGKKLIPDAPHEVLLVLDATIGQNALSQAEGFNQAADLTGVVLTKLDGTAKGGVVVGVQSSLGIPVKLVGLGEGIDDLRDFSPVNFVDALLLNEDEV